MENLPRNSKGQFIKGVKYQLGVKATSETREKLRLSHLGQKAWNKGINMWSAEERKKISETNKKLGNKPPSMLGKKNPHDENWRRKVSLAQRGEKSHLWKGGSSTINKILRRGVEFKLWREAVFKRDNWTCQECKIRGGRLHPHHIKPFALYPELRFAIDNGVALCESCHRKTDTWGGGVTKLKKQIYG